MSTHNICFCREIRKLFTWYPLLSRPMFFSVLSYLYVAGGTESPDKKLDHSGIYAGSSNHNSGNHTNSDTRVLSKSSGNPKDPKEVFTVEILFLQCFIFLPVSGRWFKMTEMLLTWLLNHNSDKHIKQIPLSCMKKFWNNLTKIYTPE